MFRAEFELKKLVNQVSNVYIVSIFACCREKFDPSKYLFVSKKDGEAFEERQKGKKSVGCKTKDELENLTI